MKPNIMSFLLGLSFGLCYTKGQREATNQIRYFRHKVERVLVDVDKGWERAVRAIECHVKNHNKLKEQHQKAAIVVELGLKAQEELRGSPSTAQVKQSLKDVIFLTEQALAQKAQIEAHLKYIEAKCQDLCTSSSAVITKNKIYERALDSAEQVFNNAAHGAVDAFACQKAT
jgi:hypothetical protein